MSRRSLRDWRQEPFSYTRMWLNLGILFAFATAPLMMVEIRGLQWAGFILWWGINALFQFPLRDFCWSRASQQFRDSIPFDWDEAAQGKGTIHSYSDLLRWWNERR